MSFPIWSILIMGLLPLFSVMPAKFTGRYDNANPRDPEYWRIGFRLRARSAELNGYEAFPLYAAAVLVGLNYGGDMSWIESLCGLTIAMRIIYILCYWTDRASLRTLAWTVAFLATLGVFTSPAWS